jgi:hypothetical protein
VHWHVNGIQFGGNERLYPGAATLEAFHADIVRHVAFAEVATLFDLPNVVGKEVSNLLDEVVHEEPIVTDLECKDRHVGTMAEIPGCMDGPSTISRSGTTRPSRSASRIKDP